MTELKRATQLAWRRHLLSPVGVEGMLYLREMSPRVGGGDSTAIVFSSGKAEGYREALDRISDVISAEPIKQEDLDNP
jgi:hypothetical protein